MIVKGIVESVVKNQAKVRIPVFDKVYTATLGVDYDSLSIASICVPAKFSMNIKSGDLVYVLFEDNNRSKPIIVGYIFNNIDSTSSADILDITVNNDTILTEDTSIGEVTKDNIKNLSGIDRNIQETLNLKKENVNTINSNLLTIDNIIENDNVKIKNNINITNNINNNINYINSLIGKNNETIMNNTLFGQLNFAKNHLNNILEKLGNVDLDKSIENIINDYEEKIKTLEDSVHNGRTFESPTVEQNSDFTFDSDLNIDKYDTLYECIMYDSTCYRGTGKMKPVGILWHDTGCDNTTIKRYVQPSKSDPNYNKLLNLIGKNIYANDWNTIEHNAGVNAWIGKLADGSIATVQALPWDYRPWGCGSGQFGSCNNGWIQFEICEDARNNSTYFNAVYKEALKLTAYLCKKYNIDPKGTVNYNGVTVPTILCHWDSYRLGVGGGHYDIYDWFPLFGKCKDLTMNDVRNDVQLLLENLDNNTSENNNDYKINNNLKEKIQSIIDTHSGNWGVYVEGISSGKNIYAYRKTSFKERVVSASLIKLWVMGAVYDQIEKGNINEADVKNDLYYMITISDNAACNRLVMLLGNNDRDNGLRVVNNFISRYNFSQTVMNRLMLEDTGTQNYTSINDCSTFVRMLYKNELISKKASQSMLNIMKDSHRIYAGAGIPENVKFAHKTGSLINLCYGDVGIVYINEPYIICEINNGTSDGPSVLKDISKLVYDSLS